MKETSLAEIRNRALVLHKRGRVWHFHILTPGCKFNKDPRYAFVLENPEEKPSLVHYSDQAERTLGKELSPLLHGNKVWTATNAGDKSYTPSDTVKQMIKRVRELSARKLEWHHHVLFPGCKYNKNTPKFTFVVEDPEGGEILESLTDSEPTDDLKQIEKFFYRQ